MKNSYTLDDLAKYHDRVLLDASVLNSSDDHKIRYHLLKEGVDYTTQILDAVKRHQSYTTVPGTLDEHYRFLTYLTIERLKLLQRNKNHPSGKVEHVFEDLLKKQKEISRQLRKRAISYPNAWEISQFLIDHDMNTPCGNRTSKKYRKTSKVSRTDALLVSNAILEGKLSCIVTRDMDIINLVKNIWILFHEEQLPWNPKIELPAYIRERLSRNLIRTYFLERTPDENGINNIIADFRWGI